MIPIKSESSHWYTPTGEPCHHVPYKDKKRAGEMRPTTLRDAKSMGLVPSVTNLLNIIANPQLQRWKQAQLLLAALTLPRMDGENEDDYVSRVIADAEAFVKQASDIGSRCHDAIEQFLLHGAISDDALVADIVQPTYKWVQENVEHVIGTEFVVVGAGYAGRVDLMAKIKGYEKPVIIDFKTRGAYNGKLSTRDSDLIQLCGYRLAIGPDTRIASILICRDEPMEPEFHVWEPEEVETGTQIFKHARAIWYLSNNIPLNTSDKL